MLDRDKLAKMRWTNPCATLQEMGDRFGVSKERVRQVLNEMDLPTRHFSEKKMVSCLKCGNPIKEGKEFCDRECQNDYNTILITCSQCGNLMERKACKTLLTENKIRLGYKGNFFCSKRCQGFWLAENHGYGVEGEVTMNCPSCGKEFHIPMGVYKVRSQKGQDLFCSRECYSKFRGEIRISKKKTERGVCGYCGNFFMSYDLLKRMEKSKSNKIFCSLNCSNQFRLKEGDRSKVKNILSSEGENR